MGDSRYYTVHLELEMSSNTYSNSNEDAGPTNQVTPCKGENTATAK
jgi:hypothetical protein